MKEIANWEILFKIRDISKPAVICDCIFSFPFGSYFVVFLSLNSFWSMLLNFFWSHTGDPNAFWAINTLKVLTRLVYSVYSCMLIFFLLSGRSGRFYVVWIFHLKVIMCWNVVSCYISLKHCLNSILS